MSDVLGWRRKFGVLGPSTNTIVQPDFEMMRPIGVTNHYSRIFTPNAQAVSNETFMAGTELIGRNVLEAVRSVMTCSPDYLVMGMSAVTFYGGSAGADAFQAKVERESGVGASIGSHSCTAALKAYGGVERIAILSPYYPVANREVARYFTDSGFEVVRDIYLECKSWTAIAAVTTDLLREKLIELNGRTTWMRSSRSEPTSAWSGWRRRPSCGSASRSSPSTRRPTGMRCARTEFPTRFQGWGACSKSFDLTPKCAAVRRRIYHCSRPEDVDECQGDPVGRPSTKPPVHSIYTATRDAAQRGRVDKN